MRFSASRMVLRAYDGQSRLEAARSARRWWPSLQPVRLALVVGTMNIDAESLLLATLAKSLVGLGYQVEVLAFSYGKAHDIWRTICRVNIVRIDKLKSVDWLNLMQEPFQFLPVVWLIHDDALGQHLRNYPELHLSIPNHIEDCCYTLPLILGISWSFLVPRLISGLLKDMAHHILKKL
ncbi:uncharacterized protein LOC124696294 [Lolium rigidum]|uniref:uncharacterized protein LOC124696294 n=1 Tax=Lolium rigidum TaxID=89674 RepID=UPI001F5D3156|nr:uncharacterized protein LOC124696294 [Lolium rigidum]